MFIVFVLSFKMFISSVYSVTAIEMPQSILVISWSFMSSTTSVTGYVDFFCAIFFLDMWIRAANRLHFF